MFAPQVSGANIFFFTIVTEGSGAKQIFIIQIIICFAYRMSKQRECIGIHSL